MTLVNIMTPMNARQTAALNRITKGKPRRTRVVFEFMLGRWYRITPYVKRPAQSARNKNNG